MVNRIFGISSKSPLIPTSPKNKMKTKINKNIKILIGLVVLCSIFITVPQTSYANDFKPVFGVGGILGEPIGASVKFFPSQTTAIQAHLGYSFPDESLALTTDLLFSLLTILDDGYPFELKWYAGVGIMTGQRSFNMNSPKRAYFGGRIPTGLVMLLETVPIEIFAEFAVGFLFTPKTGIDFDGGVGARYCF